MLPKTSLVYWYDYGKQRGSSKLQHKVVSSDNEELILVDESDTETGYLSKAACHDGSGLLHRALSVLVFNADGELLLQQRGKDKRLWPGFWSNSCCSHPRKGESMSFATGRRLLEELGIEVELEFVYKFQYQASFGESGAEHELCSVYLGRCTEEVRPNATEIDSIRFLAAQELTAEMDANPGEFTPWFRQEWDRLNGEFAGTLSRYLA
jgi:isopentenyl-diphosphate delta-isomerase